MKSEDRYEKAKQNEGKKKMMMIEKAMHGKGAGKRESKNFRGKDCCCKK